MGSDEKHSVVVGDEHLSLTDEQRRDLAESAADASVVGDERERRVREIAKASGLDVSKLGALRAAFDAGVEWERAAWSRASGAREYPFGAAPGEEGGE